MASVIEDVSQLGFDDLNIIIEDDTDIMNLGFGNNPIVLKYEKFKTFKPQVEEEILPDPDKEFIYENKLNIKLSKSAKERIIKNCDLPEDSDPYELFDDMLVHGFTAERNGKNIYISDGDYVLTINSNSMNIITGHLVRKEK